MKNKQKFENYRRYVPSCKNKKLNLEIKFS